MKSHKYFITTNEYDQWFRDNYKYLIITDILKIEEGVFVDYIKTKKPKKSGRSRTW